jgi:nitrogen fixation/metabolism regulation signal transduction histidine kinase
MVEMQTCFEERLPKVVGTESELREAITNLILNAVDAMPTGGTLTLRTKSRGWTPEDSGKRHSTHVMLEICDTGVGMDEQARKRCLEPFYSTKGRRGTGLGLAMVYGIMERHEGTIEVESELNKGTTMRLVFPIRALPQRGAVTGPPVPVSLPAMHILCIDDEPLLREILRNLLSNGGHRVEVADGGQAGLQIFRAAREHGEPFDVVITDLGMPHLDGRQLSLVLKRESPATPVIMLTGWGTIMKQDGDLPSQVDGLLSKPPKITELYEMLAKVTQKQNGGQDKTLN